MLIINADDLGQCRAATDSILQCYRRDRITSASGMVFMEDSERASEVAKGADLDVGLHVNFTQPLTGKSVPSIVRDGHERIRRFLCINKYALLFYNPYLRSTFRDIFVAQVEEFSRLYGAAPSRVDGHRHMHLCSNMLIDKILPEGIKVRRSFSFRPAEKTILNRFYRRVVDRCLANRHYLTDYFFALSKCLQRDRFRRVIELAKVASVELMTHPAVNEEYEFLMSQDYVEVLHELHVSQALNAP